MGKAWDGSKVAYDVDLWREVLRVLKPGGHLLAFGGTRTYHRMACAIEDAGFEVRDSIHWIYGSGFPKSLDVSKAIDKQRDDDKEHGAVARWLVDRMEERNITRRQVSDHFGCANVAQQWTTYWTDKAVKPRVPTWEQWSELRIWLGFGDEMDAEVWRLNGRKGQPGENWWKRGVTGQHKSAAPGQTWSANCGINANLIPKEQRDIPATDAARQWAGWGTALKPAHEPCVVARKPLDGTVAANVLAHGVGALNVDGCRIPHASAEDLATSQQKNPGRSDLVTSGIYGADRPQQRVDANGRWPANVVFDEDAARELDEQSNGASRFFYCAKASKAERFGILKCDCEALHSQPWDFEDRKQNGQTDTTSLAMDTCAATSTDECGLLTLSNGSESTDQSREDVKFTTSTEIRQTTGSKTCNSSTLLPTSVCMADASCATACGSSHADCVASSSRSALSAGTYRPKGGRSTGDVVHVTSLKSSPESVCGRCGAQLRLEAHPTQKPTSLMRWLVRLVTPPGGLVLDPFAGSGSTGVAAMREGFRFVGLELSEEYAAIARARIANAVEVQDAQLDLA